MRLPSLKKGNMAECWECLGGNSGVDRHQIKPLSEVRLVLIIQAPDSALQNMSIVFKSGRTCPTGGPLFLNPLTPPLSGVRGSLALPETNQKYHQGPSRSMASHKHTQKERKQTWEDWGSYKPVTPDGVQRVTPWTGHRNMHNHERNRSK